MTIHVYLDIFILYLEGTGSRSLLILLRHREVIKYSPRGVIKVGVSRLLRPLFTLDKHGPFTILFFIRAAGDNMNSAWCYGGYDGITPVAGNSSLRPITACRWLDYYEVIYHTIWDAHIIYI